MKSLRLRSCCTRPVPPRHILSYFHNVKLQKVCDAPRCEQDHTNQHCLPRALLGKHSTNSSMPLFSIKDTFNPNWTVTLFFPLRESLERHSMPFCSAYNGLFLLAKQGHSLRKIKMSLLNEDSSGRGLCSAIPQKKGENLAGIKQKKHFLLVQDLIQVPLHCTPTTEWTPDLLQSFAANILLLLLLLHSHTSYVEIKPLILSGASSTWNFAAALTTPFFPSSTPPTLSKHSFSFTVGLTLFSWFILFQTPNSLNKLTSKSPSVSTEPSCKWISSYH